MEIKTKKRYKPEQLAQARELYFKHNTLDSIAKETGIEVNSISYHVKTTWKAEREVKIERTDSVNNRINTMTESGIAFLEKSLRGLISSDTVQPSDMKAVADVILKLKQIEKLNQADAITESETIKPASYEEIQELFNKDPFATQPLEITND
jgi:hypothetical protein